MVKCESFGAYLRAAAAGTPTPGGGSVSVLAGALGATMACMAANFTVGKKQFADVQDEVQAILEVCEKDWQELLELAAEDVRAYGEVSAAYGMPRKTAEEKQARRKAIQQALLTAMAPPLRGVRVCARVIRHLPALAKVANPNLISDVGVAGELTLAALRGCKLNVEINLAYLKDQELVEETRAEIEALAQEAEEAVTDVREAVSRQIGLDPVS